MVGTATDLLERFGAVTAYTESDEISLIFAPHSDEAPNPLPFNGRVQKLVSVTAGFASARFNAHMQRESFDAAIPAQAALRERVERSEAHFDSRAFALPSIERLCAYVRWRAVLDCRRNSVSMLAQAHFPHRELHGVDAATCIRMLSERKGIRWDATPPFFRFGTFVKKEQFWKDAINPRTQQPVRARRTRCAVRSFAFDEATAANWLVTRFWPPAEGEADDDGAGGATAAASIPAVG
jgi:tRNA(His) guanylyltransferase